MKRLSYLFSLLMLSFIGGVSAWADDGKFYQADKLVNPDEGLVEGQDYVL